MKGTPNSYSAAELAWIKARSRELRPVAHAAFVAKFDRPDVTLGAYAGLCKRKGWATGRTGRFVTGQVAHNKGQPMPYNANSAATRFKKGQQPHNTRHLGHERVDKNGYTEISVAKRNPYTGFERHYVHKHRYLWEQANGPLPKGMALKNLDGDRSNCDPANWIAVPRGLLPRLAGGRWKRIPYDTAPNDLKPVLLAIAKLEHAARNRAK